MGIIFNFDDGEKLQPGSEISFDSMDFIIDQLGNLHLKEPEPPAQEDEPLTICMFLSRLKDSMAIGAPVLARHMDLYTQDFFNDFGLGHVLNWAINFLRGSHQRVPNVDLEGLPCGILTNF